MEAAGIHFWDLFLSMGANYQYIESCPFVKNTDVYTRCITDIRQLIFDALELPCNANFKGEFNAYLENGILSDALSIDVTTSFDLSLKLGLIKSRSPFTQAFKMRVISSSMFSGRGGAVGSSCGSEAKSFPTLKRFSWSVSLAAVSPEHMDISCWLIPLGVESTFSVPLGPGSPGRSSTILDGTLVALRQTGHSI